MKLVNVDKTYKNATGELHILKKVNIDFERGKFYAIMGRSGSGKSTLVNILGLLDDCTRGKYYIGEQNIDVSNLSNNEKTAIRGNKIGFIFQSFYLNKNLTAIENIILPSYINNVKDREKIYSEALKLMKKLGIEDRKNHKPKELSGGEQQRVAIARALINNPEIIIADEPTGNLDSKSEIDVMNILKQISLDDKVVIVVSHNQIIKKYCDVLLEINNGEIKEVKNDIK